MINRSPHIPRLELLIPADTTKKYTTLLQAGILEARSAPTTVGELLASLPGFTMQYIRERIETIFLNGLPVDDLETKINGPSPVLAISAVMPGLAGAIFRKNSFHAALRTSTSDSLADKLPSTEKITIRLKFFNIIATERGGTIFHNGCLMKSESVLKFINYRRHLFSHLLSLHCDDTPVGLDDLGSILHSSETVFLRIQEDHVST
jgi:hypothetical protein